MILTTGGAGFIGSNFVLDWLAGLEEPVLNLDKLTYAGNLANLAGLRGDARHVFVQGDIGDSAQVTRLLARAPAARHRQLRGRIHVDRSIHGPEDFIQTNIVGTFRLLEVGARILDRPAAQAERRPSASCTCRPTRSMARCRPPIRPSPKTTLRAQQPVFGEQGGQRPPGACLASHLRAAGADDQLLEQLRALPLPGEADPADASSTRWPASRCRSTATAMQRARLAVRGDHCSAPSAACSRPAGGRGLQHRRLERKAESSRS
jgi:hypothetical protein